MAKAADPMVQSAIRLPRSLHDRLKRAGGDRGMGEEIRSRLERSFEQESAPGRAKGRTDAATQELVSALAYLAAQVPEYYGPWSQDRYSFDVLRNAINVVLTQRFQPKGESVAKPTDLADIVFGEGDHLKDKEAMGRMIAAIWLSSIPKREA